MGLWGVRQTAAERWAAFGPQPALRPGEGAGGMEEAAGAGASSNNEGKGEGAGEEEEAVGARESNNNEGAGAGEEVEARRA